MAIQQVNGGVSTKQTTKNNGGSAVNVGTSTKLNKISLGYSNVGVFGTKVVEGVNAEKALTAGSFSFSDRQPIATRVTTSLAGVSNNFLASAANKPELTKSIHKTQSFRTRRQTVAFLAGNFNVFTGKFSVQPTVAVDTFSNDVAASPTRSQPGKLQFMFGAKLPKSDTYKSKTG